MRTLDARDPSATGRPLRVGLLADSLDQPAWMRSILERLAEVDYANVELVILNSGPGDVRPPPSGPLDRLGRYWGARDRLLYLLHQKIERWRFKPEYDALEIADARPLLSAAEVLEVEPRRTKYSDHFPDDALEAIRSHELDLLIRAGFRILRGGILEAARHGVWSYHHGDNRVNRGGPYGFWEVLLGWPTTGYILQILNEDLDNGYVLRRGSIQTHPLSHHLSRSVLLWRSAGALSEKIRELHAKGPERFYREHDALNANSTFYSHRLFRDPTNRELIQPLAAHIGRYVRRKIRTTLNFEQWQLRYGFRDGMSTSMWRLKPLVPPRDRFWADPCVVQADGGYWLFFEEYLYAEGRGHISVAFISDDGEVGTREIALERPYHLSYPFVFEHEGKHYMIPETADNATVELYRCDSLPGPWVLDRVLMEGAFADATLLQHDGRWWMFVAATNHPGARLTEELHLYYADSPLSTDWRPHPRNPVVTDVESARPAGRIIRHNGRMIRPAQDCSRSYGYAVRWREIIKLDTECYEEREAGVLTPSWDPAVKAIHTYSFDGRLTVVDARVQRPGLGRD